MKRKISAEPQRKLREPARTRGARYNDAKSLMAAEQDQQEEARQATRRRWARPEPKPARKAAAKPQAVTHKASVPESVPAVVAAIDLPAMRRIAGAGIVKRGAALFAQKKDLRIEGFTEDSVQVRVIDDWYYRVLFTLRDGELVSTCDCPFGQITAEVVCKHKIAAAMFLREKYIHEPLERGELKAGSRLPPERELADMLDISRPSLRTALKALSVMGLIRAKPGAGTYISEEIPEVFLELSSSLAEPQTEYRVLVSLINDRVESIEKLRKENDLLSDELNQVFAQLQAM